MKSRVLRTKGTTCHLCGLDGADTADHLMPVIYGGHTRMDNLEPAHTKCNMLRGRMGVEEARAKIMFGAKDELPEPGTYRRLPANGPYGGGYIDSSGNPVSTEW